MLMAGYENRDVCIVISGSVEAAKETRAGGSFTAGRMGPGEIFGDVLAGSHTKSPVTITAITNCEILRFPWPNLLNAHAKNVLHSQLLANMVALIASKYFALDARLDLLLIPNLRRRIAAYLLGQAKTQGANTFCIPFTRQQLAGYLGCERSALSREISRMATDGLLATNRRNFTLLQPQALHKLLYLPQT